MTPKVSPESLVATARRVLEDYPRGITQTQAVVLACAELLGSPLNPFAFDDAAILLRAERLVLDGLAASVALQTAREECPTWAAPTDTPTTEEER